MQAQRGDETLRFDVTLAELPTEVLASSDLPGEDAPTENKPVGEVESNELKLPEATQTARFFHPVGDGPATGLILWLGAGTEEAAVALADDWRTALRRDRLALLVPEPGDAARGWTMDDQEHLTRLLQTALTRPGVDRRRVVIVGEGKAGQLAYALAFAARKAVRGVVAIDSPLPRALELPDNNPNERLAVLSIETPDSPLAPLMRQDREKLSTAGYPTTLLAHRSEANGPPALDATTRTKVARWIDALDRF